VEASTTQNGLKPPPSGHLTTLDSGIRMQKFHASSTSRFASLLLSVLLFGATVLVASANVGLVRFEGNWSADPAPGQIIIDWETASERDTAGFYLLRSANGDDLTAQALDSNANERIDPEEIAPFEIARVEATGSLTEGAIYQFEDSAVSACATYHYRLVQHLFDGRLRLLGNPADSAGPGYISVEAGENCGGPTLLFLPVIQNAAP
jgi:hypothetical protein